MLNVLDTTLCCGLGVVALAVYLYTTLAYGMRTRPRGRVLLLLLFPLMALVTGNVIVQWVNGVVGYAIVAVKSIGS